MEPADGRPGDPHREGDDDADDQPQWSRPMVGRATSWKLAPSAPVSVPQWSRPMVGRATEPWKL